MCRLLQLRSTASGDRGTGGAARERLTVADGVAAQGARLFARYAHAPNELGYCGPASAAALERAACG
ncbi:DUF6390 family protein, partial [Rhodococcus zopfii]|uniref:DUF6390 family protein n=1 Tax=Rhodococcus zopfii TaxID=43772 RepID=UPI0027E135DC